MKNILFLILVLSLNLKCQGQNSTNPELINRKIDDYVLQLMNDYEIPGAAVAILKGNDVLHRGYYGNANIEFSAPVTDKTMFKLHSVTKPIASTAIFELIEQGKIALDNPIAEYFDIDEMYNSIKVSHLLTHSSGLAEIGKDRNTTEQEAKKVVFQTELQFTPGERFQYAATNYWLLQKIVEKVTKQKFQDYIINQHFNASNEDAVFSGDILEVVPNRTFEYYPNRAKELEIFEWYIPEFAHAAGGLNLTLNQMISWCQKFNKNKLISQMTKAKMWHRYPYTKDNSNRSYGWEINTINNIESYGHDGGGISYLQIIPKKDLTVIFLSNGYRHKYTSFNIVTTLGGMVDKNLKEYRTLAYQKLDAAFNNKSIDDVDNIITELKKNEHYQSLNFEEITNQLGYHRLYYYIFPRYEEAIKVFKFNTKKHPKNWNGYDSLGEAYENFGDQENAIKNYKMAIELNQDNEHSNNERLQKRIINLMKDK